MALGPQVTRGLLCPVTHLAYLACLGAPGKEGWFVPPVDRSASPTLPTCLWWLPSQMHPRKGPRPGQAVPATPLPEPAQPLDPTWSHGRLTTTHAPCRQHISAPPVDKLLVLT